MKPRFGQVHEPIAIVGMSFLYPHARTEDAYWDRICGAKAELTPLDQRFDVSTIDTGDSDEIVPLSRLTASMLGDLGVDVARFGIPPAQKVSMAEPQLMALDVVDRCLHAAGHEPRVLNRDRTDVYWGSCFGNARHLNNGMRVESSRLAADFVDYIGGDDKLLSALRASFERRFKGSAHDRVGEMASTIPARIATFFKLRGRTIAMESADATSFVALEAAMLALRLGEADAAVVASGQRIESPLIPLAMGARGLLSQGDLHALARGGTGIVLGEGAGALLLKRLSSAIRDGDVIYATLNGIANTHASRRGTFRYATSLEARVTAVKLACEQADVAPGQLQYVEFAGTGIDSETGLEIAALQSAIGPRAANAPKITAGCVKSVFGHTMANAGVAAVAKTAIALHRRLLPPHVEDGVELGDLFEVLDEVKRWPKHPDGRPRVAGVGGGSFTGSSSYIVVEEYDSAMAARRANRSHRPRRKKVSQDASKVAIVGYGGAFSDARDADSFWQNNERKLDTLRPISEAHFPRRLYFDASGFAPVCSYTDIGSMMTEPASLPDDLRMPPRRFEALDEAQRRGLSVAGEVRRSFGLPGRPMPAGRGVVVLATNLCLGAERSAGASLHYPMLERGIVDSDAFAAQSEDVQRDVLALLRARFDVGAVPLSSASLDGFLASGIGAAISNEFGIDAVPIAVEAACAGSHAAIDLAGRLLRARQYDFAIAGGIEYGCHRRELILCAALGLLSRTKITPFDAGADGFSPGDGVAMFFMRRYEDATANREPMRAIIRAVGASNDAKSLIAPSAEGQALAVRRAFEQVDFAPSTVQYIEAHGTGTVIGDDVEVRAVAAGYGGGKRSAPLAIASVKSMIGHTLSAAGGAGLLRAVIGINRRVLPPSINVTRLNPKLVLQSIPAYINTEPSTWPAGEGAPRRAAVSSFGTGGINYHLLVEEPDTDG